MKRFSCFNLVLFCLLFTTGCGLESHQLQISSEPSGAEVYFQNNLLGVTPIETQVEPQLGDYNVYEFRAEKDEYIPNKIFFKEEFYDDTVVDVVPEKVHFLMVKRKKYPIHITSEPSGATLIFNGSVIGKTPMMVTVMEHIGTARTFQFTVEKEGYKSKHKDLKEYIAENNETPFHFPEVIHFDF